MGFGDQTTSGPVTPRADRVHDDNYVLNELKRAQLETQDNFGRGVSNPLRDLIDVDGSKDFTPERLRYFKDGTRRFLQYGTDANFTETEQGHKLSPGSDQTLTLKTAEKAAYQVGFDIWPTNSYQVIGGPPQSGDVVGGGYGVLDLANFDPATISYSGTDADGYFWYHTADTGLDHVLLAEVGSGTILDSRTVTKEKAADVFSIIEQRLNWYAVGPSVYREIFTDIATIPKDPQINRVLGATANDDGKGSDSGNHRQTLGIHQASGNSGLEFEVGSIAIRAPGEAAVNYKAKGHEVQLENTDTTDDFQVAAAIRIDTDREDTKLRFPDFAITGTPGSSTSTTEVLLMAVDPANTDADSNTFEAPRQHSESNSIVRQVEDNTITGPIEDDAGTDVTGATTANTMTDPGGFQIGRAIVRAEGTGSNISISETTARGNRELYPSDIGLFLINGNDSGTATLDVLTEQNS